MGLREMKNFIDQLDLDEKITLIELLCDNLRDEINLEDYED